MCSWTLLLVLRRTSIIVLVFVSIKQFFASPPLPGSTPGSRMTDLYFSWLLLATLWSLPWEVLDCSFAEQEEAPQVCQCAEPPPTNLSWVVCPVTHGVGEACPLHSAVPPWPPPHQQASWEEIFLGHPLRHSSRICGSSHRWCNLEANRCQRGAQEGPRPDWWLLGTRVGVKALPKE